MSERDRIVDLPAPPRSKDDGIAIFACEHTGTSSAGKQAFMVTVKDPPKVRPTCPACGLPGRHVGHETAQRLMALKGAP